MKADTADWSPKLQYLTEVL